MNKQRYLSTPAMAEKLDVSPATVRNAHSKYGNYRGITPTKLFNNRLAWPRTDVAAIKAAHEAEQQRQPSAETQREIILKGLRNGPKTTDELRQMLVYQVAARIKELRQLGYDITTHLVPNVDRDGVMRQRMALYTLESELGFSVVEGV